MVRISDIFDKYKEEKKKSQNSPQAEVSPIKPDELNLCVAVGKELEKINIEVSLELYNQILSIVKKTYRQDIDYSPDFAPAVNNLVEKTIDLLSTENNGLVRLALAEYPDIKEYLYHHAVNVYIISLDLGLGLNLDHKVLLELGGAALLHDMGLIKYMDIINRPELLSDEQYNVVRAHTNDSMEMFKKIGKDLSINIGMALLQEHERIDGSGYPAGLKGANILEISQIVGLADCYEAMTHSRPYRKKRTPLETIKAILINKSMFESRILKVLIERIGIFPVGMLVRLNTKEIALVLEGNSRIPLRPIVRIICDINGRELKEHKQVDLAENSVIYIEDCLEQDIWKPRK